MRRALSAVATAVVGGLLLAGPANAGAQQPPGDIKNVELVGNIPTDTEATAINFLEYGKGRHAKEVMFTVGRFGLRAYDLRRPTRPERIGELTSESLKLEGDTSGTFWQNEDMDVDEDRKLVFLARDPRAYSGTTTDPDDVAGVYIIDARNPRDLKILTFVELPTGHTTTRIEDCDYLWTGGPASNSEQLSAWPQGRPIIVTDIRNPRRPMIGQVPVDLFRNDGVTAYAHDVQVDADGIAWVSGLGGIRGYHTDGWHYDPLEGRRREASPIDPIPYAGGKLEETVAPTAFMHNSLRPVGRTLRDGPKPTRGIKRGSLIMGTEEAFVSNTCEGVGNFTIASLQGSYDGEGWRSTPEDPFRLETVGTWSVFEKEGTVVTSANCSAHYFEMDDGILAYAWYANGTRFIDVSDPRNPIQVAYYRPDGTNVWAPYFHGDYIYTADHGRGIDILRLTKGHKKARNSRKEVLAPAPRARHKRMAARQALGLRPDPDVGWVCPLPQ